MATNIKNIQYQYPIKEHSFIFLSIVYGFLISCFLSDIYGFLSRIDHPIYREPIRFFWLITLFLYVLNSWWATWSEQNSIIDFFDFLLFLFNALGLFFLEKLSFREDLYHDPWVNLWFFAFIADGLLLIILIRNRFDDNHLSNFFKTHMTRLFPIIYCIAVIFYIYFNLSALTYNNYYTIHKFFIILSGITLACHIVKNRNQLDFCSPGEFLIGIIQYATPDYINRRCIGFLIIDAKKIPKSKITSIYKYFRKYDIWASGKNKSYYFFFSGLKSIENKINDKLLSENISPNKFFMKFIEITSADTKKKSIYNERLIALFKKVYEDYCEKCKIKEKRSGLTTT